jgi:Asp/Glu/hydantoin racemase
MEHTLALIHTSQVLVPVFDELCATNLAEVRRVHIVDESLIRDTIAAGRLQDETIERLVGHAGDAFREGATAVLVTCSSIGPAVGAARARFGKPVFRIDEAMAAKAVSMGPRIGVLATLRTTLEPTVELIHEAAARAGAACQVIEMLCAGAFEAVLAGEGTRHDQLVREGLAGLAGKVDAVVLAQASMARVLATMAPGELPAPVLTSPELAIAEIGETLCRNRADSRGALRA